MKLVSIFVTTSAEYFRGYLKSMDNSLNGKSLPRVEKAL